MLYPFFLSIHYMESFSYATPLLNQTTSTMPRTKGIHPGRSALALYAHVSSAWQYTGVIWGLEVYRSMLSSSCNPLISIGIHLTPFLGSAILLVDSEERNTSCLAGHVDEYSTPYATLLRK